METRKYFELKPQRYTMKYGEVFITLLFVGFHGQSCKFHIVTKRGRLSEAVYIPKAVIRIIEEEYLERLDWFWDKPTNKHKLKLAGVL